LHSFGVVFNNGKAEGKPPKKAPIFLKVAYQGNDLVYKDYPLESDEFYNLVLQGCYPDPAITRKDDDYYLVCSSFAMFPGVPIFHSNDLVNLTQIRHVLNRISHLDVHNTGISAGVYALGTTYNPYYYIFNKLCESRVEKCCKKVI
jgi:alpha-N-arabinofuranosidase